MRCSVRLNQHKNNAATDDFISWCVRVQNEEQRSTYPDHHTFVSQGKTLEALERKMRTYETNIFFLKEFVETKGREIDFQSLRGECMGMVKELNVAVKKKGETEGFGMAY